VDLDGDGIGDILTGSFPGELYFFQGKGEGQFAAPVKLQREGKDINLGPASTVFAVDWRGTGRLDLLIGNMQGDLYLIPNDGSNAKPTYGSRQKLEAGGPADRSSPSRRFAARRRRLGRLRLTRLDCRLG